MGTTGDDEIKDNDPAANADIVNPYRFNSARFDGATGTYDMGFREYNPGLNRFLTRDMFNGALTDLGLGTDPWNANRYMFGGGNPISRIESGGHRNEMDYHGRKDRSGGKAVTQRLGSRDVTAEDAGDFSAAYDVAASKHIGEGGGQGHAEIVECNDMETWKVENGRKETCGQSDVRFSKLFAEEMCRQPGIVCGPYSPTGPTVVGLGHDSGAVRLTGGPEAPTGRRATGGGGCFRSFSGETNVLMADGSVKPISEVKAGDMVMATDPDTGERGPREVTKLWVHEDTVVNLEVDGTAITTTEDHPFWNATDGEFQRADELDRGDQLLAADGRTVRVGGIHPGSQRAATAYNLTVDDIHTYYVLAGNTPVLVHNTAGCSGDRWTSRRNLDDHYDAHGEQMGFATKSEYDYAARDLMCTCEGRRPGMLIKQDGTTRYYFDPKTGEFGITVDRGIVTYFNADKAYFNGQPGTLVP
ncbi:polymorphic toxin-type HINT domain-containing protein [Kribbella sp. NPDC050124]|uniref:polymorphic toxin-type HINT domain-containing protein n=1 Tax=Kribbella sp. NPDC050124 TaxID=3364114 RepID=UPI0037ABB670